MFDSSLVAGQSFISRLPIISSCPIQIDKLCRIRERQVLLYGWSLLTLTYRRTSDGTLSGPRSSRVRGVGVVADGVQESTRAVLTDRGPAALAEVPAVSDAIGTDDGDRQGALGGRALPTRLASEEYGPQRGLPREREDRLRHLVKWEVHGATHSTKMNHKRCLSDGANSCVLPT